MIQCYTIDKHHLVYRVVIIGISHIRHQLLSSKIVVGVVLALALHFVLTSVHTVADTTRGEEWPVWRGPRGDGTWKAPMLPNVWPKQKLPVIWRQRVGGGYSGVVVADGRVYTMDRQTEPSEVERVLCFDSKTGKRLWTHSYDAPYQKLTYDSGPRASPTVYEGRVYTLGAVGHMCCLDAESGQVIWSQDAEAQLNAERPRWGFAASPVIWRNLVIMHIGARPKGCLVAFDRISGNEVWRSSDDPAGYCTPIIIEHEGNEQIICWTPEHILGISPNTGEIYWSVPYKVTNGVSIATPIFHEELVFVSGYWEGSKAIRLGKGPRKASLIWTENQYLRALMSQPLYRDGHIYLLDKSYGLTCFKLQTGEKLWDDEHKMTPRGRNPQATMVWAGDSYRVLVLNSDGELILARFTPGGYIEQSRTKIIGHTWAHPAYAGDCVYARNDSELVCVRLTGTEAVK